MLRVRQPLPKANLSLSGTEDATCPSCISCLIDCPKQESRRIEKSEWSDHEDATESATWCLSQQRRNVAQVFQVHEIQERKEMVSRKATSLFSVRDLCYTLKSRSGLQRASAHHLLPMTLEVSQRIFHSFTFPRVEVLSLSVGLSRAVLLRLCGAEKPLRRAAQAGPGGCPS